MENRLKELEKARFYLNMKDHWTQEDWAIISKLDREIANIKNALIKKA